jgi:Ser/Thr protein kinase RdoA (MazF antagonist)
MHVRFGALSERRKRRQDAVMHALEREVTAHYPQLGAVEARLAYSSVHEMVEVRAAGERYALKLYRPGVRSVDDVKWETALHRHLLANGAPVAELITGTSGDVETIEVSGTPRVAVLSAWAPGSKPSASEKTYRLVGRAAAEIHAAADSFSRALDRTPRDLTTELHAHLELLRPALEQVGRWDAALALAERLEGFVSSHRLERGVCHNDLTLDNVHIDADRITVFDLDTATVSWRAAEPQGVFHSAQLSGGPWWAAWQAGYSDVRTMPGPDVEAVPWFVLLSQFENTAWKLGLTPTSIGPLITLDDLGTLVDRWSEWGRIHCRP